MISAVYDSEYCGKDEGIGNRVFQADWFGLQFVKDKRKISNENFCRCFTLVYSPGAVLATRVADDVYISPDLVALTSL